MSFKSKANSDGFIAVFLGSIQSLQIRKFSPSSHILLPQHGMISSCMHLKFVCSEQKSFVHGFLSLQEEGQFRVCVSVGFSCWFCS